MMCDARILTKNNLPESTATTVESTTFSKDKTVVVHYALLIDAITDILIYAISVGLCNRTAQFLASV